MGNLGRRGSGILQLVRSAATQRAWIALAILVTAVLLFSEEARATALPSSFTSNTTLKAANSPYTGTYVAIEAGVTVHVEAGVEINLTELSVGGSLLVEGTAEKPVVFTSYAENGPGEWNGIAFEAANGASVIDHAEIKYGGSSKSVIRIIGASPTITNSTFLTNKNGAIRVTHGGSPEIAYNRFIDTRDSPPIRYLGEGYPGEVNIHNNFIEGGYSGIYVDAGEEVSTKLLAGNTVIATIGEEAPITYVGPDIPNITDNVVEENAVNELAVSGTIASSTSWDSPNIPIQLLNSISVSSGKTFKIGAGTLIYVGTPYVSAQITVSGTLDVEGTIEEPVIFTSRAEAGPGEWPGIEFGPGSGASVIDHAEIKYGGSSKSVIRIIGASPTITNSTFLTNKNGAIRVTHGGSPEIAYNRFIDTRDSPPIRYLGEGYPGEVNIHNNFIEGGYSGIYVDAGEEVTSKSLSDNTVTGTTGEEAPVSYVGPDIPDITSNLIEGNTHDRIAIGGTVAHSMVWSTPVMPIYLAENVTVAAGKELTINAGTAFYMGTSPWVFPVFAVAGTLDANGTAAEPVVFSGPNETSSGEWPGIIFQAGSSASVLDHVEVAYGGMGGPMIEIFGSSPTITNSTIRKSAGYGIRVRESGAPTIEWTRFRNNVHGLRYEGEGTLAALHNDWGCARGPQPTGCGDDVSGNIQWEPAAILQEMPRYCPGYALSAKDPSCLLRKYEPMLRYDSEESYHADSAAEITDNWGDSYTGLWGEEEEGAYGNTLVDGDGEGPLGGTAMAKSNPTFEWGSYLLDISALLPTYPDSWAADENDWIDESEQYEEDAHALEAAGYLDYAYGKVITDGTGKRWLEYWYFYYYNKKSVAGFGAHEGDWESILVGLGSNDKPDEVILSQHAHGAKCAMEELEQSEAGGPVSFVGLDSHANYPVVGTYELEAVGVDYANGSGAAVTPPLVVIGEDPTSWITWPGHWGNSRPGGVFSFFESGSPQGPAFHEAWSDPATYAEEAEPCRVHFLFSRGDGRAEVGGSPSIQSVTLDDGHPEVHYRVPGGDEDSWPRLRLTVDERHDGGVPPDSKMIWRVPSNGKIRMPSTINPGNGAVVRGSLFFKNGLRVTLEPKVLG